MISRNCTSSKFELHREKQKKIRVMDPGKQQVTSMQEKVGESRAMRIATAQSITANLNDP